MNSNTRNKECQINKVYLFYAFWVVLSDLMLLCGGWYFSCCWRRTWMRQIQIYLLILLRNKLKPGRFPYLEDEARQVSLYGIVLCTRMIYSSRLISYPPIFYLSLKVWYDVIIKLGRVVGLWNGHRLRGHKRGNGAKQNGSKTIEFINMRQSSLQNKRRTYASNAACRWGLYWK